MREGITLIGNIVHDLNKRIERFPERNGLVRCTQMASSMGGLTGNVSRDLARLDPALPVQAIGMVGEDSAGDEMLRMLRIYPNINTDCIGRRGQTSFTDVLAEEHTKVRSFIYYAGANALFEIEDAAPEKVTGRIAHVGYALLMDRFDAPDDVCGTRMAHLLHDLQAAGIRTSMDVVSEASDRYRSIVPHSMRYADIVFMNEIEAERTVGFALRDGEGLLQPDAVAEALHQLRAMGAKGWIIIHAPEGVWGLDRELCYVPGALVEKDFIAGTVGAGDALSAGTLLGAYRGMCLRDAMECGVAAATASLRSDTPADAVPALEDALALLHTLPRVTLG